MFRTAIAIAVLTLGSASASAITATSIRIGSALADPNQAYLQISEVVALQAGSFANVALGGTATATSLYNGSSGPSVVIDNVFPASYPNIYHGANSDGTDFLTLTLSKAYNLSSLSIYGRTDDCCTFRDVYSYKLFNGVAEVASGVINAANARHMGTAVLAAVPEPETYAMLLAGLGVTGFVARRRSKRPV